jgi:hypothetical protein
MKVPIPYEVYGVNRFPLVFSRWFPLGDENAITINLEDASVKLWFDKTCTSHVFDIDWDKIDQRINLLCGHVLVDVTIKRMSENLISKIINNEEYIDIGIEVYTLAITYVNRFISFCKNILGQFWLREYIFDTDLIDQAFIEWEAKAKFQDDNWFRWKPTNKTFIKCGVSEYADRKRYLSNDKWSEIEKYVKSNKRPSLVLELLSNAEDLNRLGRRRNALIEAVTALEVAINNFGRAFKNELPQSITSILTRVNMQSLPKYINHLGLEATCHYLLPLLIAEDIFGKNSFQICWDAINERNNVVHNGQRDIDPKKLPIYLTTVRNLCETLEQMCDEDCES